MLIELRVRDLGVIEDLTLEFGPGMTVLTGETGAGKTLVVEALQLVLGGRANAGMVRAGAAEALVEARFVVGEGERRDGGGSGDGGDGGDAGRRQRGRWGRCRARGDRGPIGARLGTFEGLARRAHDPGERAGRVGGRARRAARPARAPVAHEPHLATQGPRRVRRHRPRARARAARPAARARPGPGRAGRGREATCPRGRRAALPGRRDRRRAPGRS